MKICRRRLLHLGGAAAIPFASQLMRAEHSAAQSLPASSDRPLAERLAAYASGLRYEDLDKPTIERVKALLIDTIGCGMGAWEEKPVRICREIALAVDGPATIIGTHRKTTPEMAAFANGAAFRYLDFNDTYIGRFAIHPSDNIGACLAVAEAERANVEELIVAIVLAYEINCRLVDALDIAKRGWDPPVLGLPAMALAAGRLMKLSTDQLTHAVSLAINDHIPLAQTRVGVLSEWKGIAAAEAARNAVFAARLARAGLTGPAPIFEGSSGFFQQVAGPANVDVDAFGRPGVAFRLHQCTLKPYPAVIYTQTAIVAGIEVAKDVGSLDRIAAIEIATTSRGYLRTGSEPEKWSPKTRETADHSLPYVTARAMFDGDITNESFAPHKFSDPAILAFMQKIKVTEDPVLTARGGGAVPTRITAILFDGQRISHEVDHAPGFAERPMSRGDVERKFGNNARRRWPDEQTAAVVQALWSLERSDNVATLLSKLALNS